MISSIGRYINGAVTEEGRYNGALVDETGIYGLGASPDIFSGGGAVAGGSAVIQFRVIETLLVSGGAVAGGYAATQYILPVSGGAVSGGAATFQFVTPTTATFTTSGGAVAAGAALILFPTIVTMPVSGGAVAGGIAAIPAYFISTGGAVSSGSAITYQLQRLIGSGGAVSAGDAVLSPAKFIPVSGGAVSGGTALPIITRRHIVGSGGAVAGSNGRFTAVRANVAPGDIVLMINGVTRRHYMASGRLLSAGPIRRPMGGITGTMETANASATLDNSDGVLSAEFGNHPPLAAQVSIVNSAGEEMFVGLVSGIKTGASISLDFEAGNRFPLSRKIPLLSTKQLPGYRVEANIPIIYGSMLINPVAADSGNQVFIVAAHPCQEIEKVFIDNAPITGWTWTNKTWPLANMATITLARPLDANERITCKVRGKMSPRTGALMTNPADIIWDIMANVCDIPLDYAELDRFRSDMATAGINLAGVINDGRRTIRSVIDEVASSSGSVWGGQVPGIAARYLGATVGTPRAVILADDITGIEIGTSLSDIATVLDVGYGYDHTQSQHGKSASLESVQAIKSYERNGTELLLPWVHDTRTAVILAEHYLTWKSTPQWNISIETGGKHLSIMPGWYVSIQHPHLPGGSAIMLVTDAELDLFDQSIRIKGSIPATLAMPVSLSHVSSAFDPQTLQGSSVQFANGQATVTFADDAGKPLVGAKVTMDGKQVRTTDKAGRATFTAARGSHSIKVEASGYAVLEGDIVI